MTTAASDYLNERKRPRAEGLWKRQVLGILRLELKKNLIGRRAWGVYFLAFAPVLLVAVWSITPSPGRMFAGPSESFIMFASIYVSLYLRGSIFLATLLMFMSLFRSEILERSLHYYFLSPVRREVLVIGKYLSALFATWMVFTIGTIGLFIFTTIPWGLGTLSRYLFQGPGLENVVAYVSVTLFAVAGYGAIFLLAGQFFKNPVVPAVVIGVWELLIPIMPTAAKKLSVAFYLGSFYPVAPPEDSAGCLAFLQVLADPPPVWLSIVGLLVFTGLVLVAAGWRARTMEVSYGDD